MWRPSARCGSYCDDSGASGDRPAQGERENLVDLTAVDVTSAARRAGLTRRQFRYYAHWYAGETQQQIADRFGSTRSRVNEVIARALRRNPDLPRPTCRRGLTKGR
jgi:hypothetical protein